MKRIPRELFALVFVLLSCGLIANTYMGGQVNNTFSKIGYGMNDGGGYSASVSEDATRGERRAAGPPANAPAAANPLLAPDTGSPSMSESTATTGSAAGASGEERVDASIHTGTTVGSNYQSSLTAGQVDDNAKFPQYLTFLGSYQSPDVLTIPVQKRLFIRVLDGEQRPVAGALVQLYDGERQVFYGRTVSDGRILFFPEAAAATQAQSFRAVISRGNDTVEAALDSARPEQSVVFKPLQSNTGPVHLDIVFLVDATGSMGDEIAATKGTIHAVASRIEQLPGSSAPRFGLVAYRDRGDDYVTRSWPFGDVNQFASNLSSVEAHGGGDIPESVTEGLHDAINLQGWSDNGSGRHLRLVVLVGDAPPQMYSDASYNYKQLLDEAVAQGIKIFPIGASGLDKRGEYIFRQLAQVTQGQFVFLTYADGVSGAPGASTTHSVSEFTVNNLDNLVVNLVAGEVANQTGEPVQSSNTVPLTAQAVIIPPKPSLWGSILAQVKTALSDTVETGLALAILLALGIMAWKQRPNRKARVALEHDLGPAATVSIQAYTAPLAPEVARLSYEPPHHDTGQPTLPLGSFPPPSDR